jgi:ketosteroid isomerase-like protein
MIVSVEGDLESRLASLEAIEAIRVLKARYADVCDTGYDPERMRPFFTDDAVWDGGPRFGRHEGIEAICGFFAGVSSQITWALHYMVAPIVEVADDGETASASWYLLEPCTIATDEGPRAMLITGRYADRYRREPDGWKFTEVVLDCQTISPLDEGWAVRPFWNE